MYYHLLQLSVICLHVLSLIIALSHLLHVLSLVIALSHLLHVLSLIIALSHLFTCIVTSYSS